MVIRPSLLSTVALAIPLVLAADSSSPDAGIRSARPGDTVTVCIHRVMAPQRGGYERWLGEVSAPAFRRAGERFPSSKAARAAMRRFVPVVASGDTLTYVYLWERPARAIRDEPGKSTSCGYRADFEDAGMPSDSIEAALNAFKQLVLSSSCIREVEQSVSTGR
jgi:hypothetical protein